MTVTGTVGAGAASKAVQSRPAAERFELGEWRVDPAANRLLHANDGEQSLEPRAMAVLLALCASPGEVISADTLLVRCWGDALVEGGLGDNPVHKSINQLRRALGDSATAPRYIETIRKRGYRVIAPVRGGQGQARSGAWQGGSPFRGLQAFDTRHAEVFFGREQATQELLSSVTAQMQRQHGLVLVLGPSGSGKTSLVSAGLIPTLQREPLAGRWQLVSHSQLDLADLSMQPAESAGAMASPAAFPLVLAAALLDWETPAGEPLLAGFNAHDLARALTETPATVLAELHAALQRQGGSGQPFALVFIDRLEALFRPPLGEEAQREPALRLLQQLAESGSVLIVAACRNDYYPQLAQHPWLMRDKAQGGHLDLAPPSRAEIAQMVRLPARAAGLSFGIDTSTHQRLDDLLCDAAAASPDALPLLQYTLEQLYQQRSAHGELTFAAYQALGGAAGGMGGLEGVIAEQAEQLIRAMTPVQQDALPHVLALLVLVGEDESSPVGGRRALWSELHSAAERELVRALVDARLLVSEHSTEFAREEPGFRVAHEALLRRWPRVTDWIAQHRQDLQTRARLRQQVQRWEQGGRAAEFLWPRGRQLQEGLELMAGTKLALSPEERQFLRSCEQRAARGGRLRLAAVISIGVLALAASWAAWRNMQLIEVVSEKNRASRELVSSVLGNVLEQLRPAAKLSVLEAVGSKALHVLGPVEGEVADPEGRLQRARALLVIGEAAMGRRDVETALRSMEAVLALLKGEAAVESRGEWFKALGAAQFWLGQIAESRREGTRAQQHYRAYRDHILDWLKLEPNAVDAWTELGYAQTMLGHASMALGEWSAAAEAFDQALKLSERVLALRPGEASRIDDLANLFSFLAVLDQVMGKTDLALQRSERMIGLLDAMSESRRAEPAWQVKMSKALRVRSWIQASAGMEGASATTIQRARQLARQVASHDPENKDVLVHELWVDVDAMILARDPADPELANAMQQIAQRLERLEAKGLNGPERTQWIRAAWLDAACAHAELAGELDRAADLCRRAHTIWTQEFDVLAPAWLPAEYLAKNEVRLFRLLKKTGPASVREALAQASSQRWAGLIKNGMGGAALNAWLIAEHSAQRGHPELLKRLTANGYKAVDL